MRTLITRSLLIGTCIMQVGCTLIPTGPEYWYCRGEGSFSASGGAMIYSGNANVTTKCPDTGLIFYQGKKQPGDITVPPTIPGAK